MKFSVIVPVYNVEKHLAKCLDSILNQGEKDFELIVVNDGSPDNSQAIIDEYQKNYPDFIKGYVKENGGLSDARNYGVERASGDYLVFVDSDDCISADLLETLSAEIDKNNPDVIGFRINCVSLNGEILGTMTKPILECVRGETAIRELALCKQCFEPAWGYAYKKCYWSENQFSFMEGIYHEDYALIPLVIFKANRVSLLDYIGYLYFNNDQSITQLKTAAKTRKMAFDLLKGYDYLLGEITAMKREKSYEGRLLISYLAASLLYRFDRLEGELKEEYRKELQKRAITSKIISDTFKRKVRKLLIKIKYKF